MQNPPILWSFRRCPYAMRARLAIKSSGQTVELREILLRDKPDAFLATSAKGTVPVLNLHTNVIAESIDIMHWALGQADPDRWLNMPDAGHDLIAQTDGTFKTALDLYKYHVRHPDGTRDTAQESGAVFLRKLNAMLDDQLWLFGHQTLADMAILPFVRQFANTDRVWFDAQDWPHLKGWLNRFMTGDTFAAVMHKYRPWQVGQDRVLF